ncbi:MAG: glycosyltransferase family 4 protein [candidate division KSB1 bacterium]|nr:glycosyltransferase family 4 protein [candidate division KSB1 bacterium]
MKHMRRHSRSEKKRILMIAPQPWFQPRGTPFSVLHRIKALSLLGHTIDLCTYPIGQDIDIPNLTIHRTKKPVFVKSIKIGPSKTKVLLDIPLIMLTWKLLRRNRYDFIHSHEEGAFWGAWLAAKYHVPHLYDMHSSLPQQLDNFKFTRLSFPVRLFERLEHYVIRRSSGIITICPELQQYVEKHFPEQKSLLVENVADNAIVFPPNPANKKSLRQNYGLPDKPLILYYGTFEPYQGLDLLIRSAPPVIRQFDGNVHFVLIGGNEQQIADYKAMTAEQDVADFFTFTGFLQPEWIPPFVDMASVLVSPRLKGTNSPLKIYSYLRSGVPVVATRHITHTQLLSDNEAFLAELNPDAFAGSLIDALTDQQRRETIVRQAKKLAEKKYGYQNYLDKTAQVVHQTVEQEL